jgi:hypothetical protein
MNMDYALSYAANYHTAGLNQIITFYDINCQYHKHLHARMDKGAYLSLPWAVKIIPGIGLWHIHGHQDSCYCRYAPTFIPGAARIDGEIMETLWASLNIISPSARGMGTPHRKEVLDFQMGDCNFMKMIRMSEFSCFSSKCNFSHSCRNRQTGKSLCRKYKAAVAGVAESMSAFESLNESADPDLVIEWLEDERIAQAERSEDPTSMDVYEVKLEKGKSLPLSFHLKPC